MGYRTTRVSHTRRKNTLRTAEKKLHEIRIMDMKIEKGPAKIRTCGVSALFAPTGHLGDPPEPRCQDFAETFLFHDLFEPVPPRPKSHAHRRHEEPRGGFFGPHNL